MTTMAYFDAYFVGHALYEAGFAPKSHVTAWGGIAQGYGRSYSDGEFEYPLLLADGTPVSWERLKTDFAEDHPENFRQTKHMTLADFSAYNWVDFNGVLLQISASEGGVISIDNSGCRLEMPYMYQHGMGMSGWFPKEAWLHAFTQEPNLIKIREYKGVQNDHA